MGARNPEKELLKNFGSFDTCVNLVESALKSTKTKTKKLYELKTKLESLFYSLDEAFRLYKADAINKDAKTDEAFNGTVSETDNSPAFPHNDSWYKEQFEKYIEKTEDVEEKIEALEEASGKVVHEDKPAEIVQENVDHVVTEVQSQKASLGQTY